MLQCTFNRMEKVWTSSKLPVYIWQQTECSITRQEIHLIKNSSFQIQISWITTKTINVYLIYFTCITSNSQNNPTKEKLPWPKLHSKWQRRGSNPKWGGELSLLVYPRLNEPQTEHSNLRAVLNQNRAITS